MKRAGGVSLAMLAVTAVLLACGPWPTTLDPVTAVTPAYLDAYHRGELGVVRPRLARRYLVQAYRVLTGKPSLADTPAAPVDPSDRPPKPPYDTWIAARDRVLGPRAAASTNASWRPPTW